MKEIQGSHECFRKSGPRTKTMFSGDPKSKSWFRCLFNCRLTDAFRHRMSSLTMNWSLQLGESYRFGPESKPPNPGETPIFRSSDRYHLWRLVSEHVFRGQICKLDFSGHSWGRILILNYHDNPMKFMRSVLGSR